MRRLFLAGTLLFWMLTSFAQKTVYDANATKRTVGSFHGIDASAGIQVLISQGNEEGVAVSVSDPEYADRIRTEVKSGILHIYRDNDWRFWNQLKNFKATVYVSFKNLDKIEVSSGASVKGDIKGDNLSTSQSSGGMVYLKGSVAKLKSDASSGGMLRAFDLATDFLSADVSSGGGIEVTVNKEVNADASSGGFVRYKGQALIRDISTSSGGSVKRIKE
jgi:hypothetical protein